MESEKSNEAVAALEACEQHHISALKAEYLAYVQLKIRAEYRRNFIDIDDTEVADIAAL